jgi:hypothetical protein
MREGYSRSLPESSRRRPGPNHQHSFVAGVNPIVLLIDYAVWVPAQGRDDDGYRQCNNRVSNKLISLPTASPNSDRITTPASS